MLGVLGGMGPAATVDFLAKVIRHTPAVRDQDHIPVLACIATDTPDRTAAILDGGADPFPSLLTALKRLEHAGASLIVMPCNTAHHWFSALQASTGVPMVHIADAVIAGLSRRAPISGPIGIMATMGTVAAGIYTRRLLDQGYQTRLPTAEGQARISAAIGQVKGGEVGRAYASLAAEADVLLQAGCDAVIMGCTEIPVGLSAQSYPFGSALIDATDELASLAVATFKSAQAPQG